MEIHQKRFDPEFMTGLFFSVAYENTTSFDSIGDFSVLMSKRTENPAGVKITPFFEAPGWKGENKFVEPEKPANTVYARSFKDMVNDVAPGTSPAFFEAEEKTDFSVCPVQYPFAYYHGKYCCHYKKEKSFTRQHSACDGGELGFYSSCCYKNQFTKCPRGKCRGNSSRRSPPSSSANLKPEPVRIYISHVKF